jgi:hypothetical protein
MLASASRMQLDASMSTARKRTRVTASKTAAVSITIRAVTREKAGVIWNTFLVQGWQENGKWQRKQFKEKKEAERFAALKRVEVENQGRAQRMILSSLTDDQADEASRAYERLGSAYTLSEAVEYFLRHHRPPEFTIRVKAAIGLYLDDRERDGIRPRSLKAIKSVLEQFAAHADDPLVNEATPSVVENFLRSLRARNLTDRASLKTWNNYRNDLNGFFSWCATPDTGTNRPFTFENPVTDVRKFKARQVREGQNAKPVTTAAVEVHRMFSALMRWRGGVMVRHFAYLYFAGIRPEELKRMAGRETELVNLKTRTITIPANVSKTRHERQIKISENLAAWLEFTAGTPIIPPNFDRLVKQVRKHFSLSHDEARHSFISYHVALHRSVGDAALQAGNSESIVKRHYLNTHPKTEGSEFFHIFPNTRARRAEILPEPSSQRIYLNAV